MQDRFDVRIYQAGSGDSHAASIVIERGQIILSDGSVISLDTVDLDLVGHDEDRIKLHDRQSGIAIMCVDGTRELLETLHRADVNGHLASRANETRRKVAVQPLLKSTYWVRMGIGFVCILVVGYFGLNALFEAAADKIDPSLEAKIGEAYIKDKVAQMDTSSASYKRVVRIGKKLVSKLPKSPYDFHFYVAKTSDVNASALPGGYVIVNQGLIDQATSDDEIAGVLGHEFGHVIHRDGLRSIVHSMGVTTCIAMIAGVGGDYAAQIAQALVVGKFFEGQSFTRVQEARCDIFGAGLTVASGFDGEGMIKFFQRLRGSGGSVDNKLLEILSDHPLDSDRITAIKAEIERLKKEKPEWFVKAPPAVIHVSSHHKKK